MDMGAPCRNGIPSTSALCSIPTLSRQTTGSTCPSPQLQRHVMHPRFTPSAAARTQSLVEAAQVQAHPPPPLLQGFMRRILERYYERTPTAVTILSLLEGLQQEPSPLHFDHLAFRTFGVEGLGIHSISNIFRDFGYTQRDRLHFPAKKLSALWFAPPSYESQLPRIFVSELKVGELSPAAQEVIARYTCQMGGLAGRYAPMSAATGVLPWTNPHPEDYDLLAQESEYAAWVLVNGYALNHTTVAVHHMRGLKGGIEGLVQTLQQQGFRLNEAGGIVKVSPDGGLLQASTLADGVPFVFADGGGREVPGAYLEFAQRLPLPEHAHIPEHELREEHRRDGFETANADRIFESTLTVQ